MKEKRQSFLIVISKLLVIIFLIIWNQQIIFSQSVNVIIADHTIVDQYDQIPQEWIDEVKKMWLNVPGESHSRAYREGLELLYSIDSRFRVVQSQDGTAEPYTIETDHLRVNRAVRTPTSGWRWGTGENIFWSNEYAVNYMKNHLDYCQNHLAEDQITEDLKITAMGFGWCWDMTWHHEEYSETVEDWGGRWGGAIDYYDEDSSTTQTQLIWGLTADDTPNAPYISLQDYLDAIDEYNSAYPDVVSFFTTGPVDGNSNTELGLGRYIKHQAIRNHVAADPNRVLFDYADILTHNDAGEQYVGSWEGHEYPSIHPDNRNDLEGNLNTSVGHIGATGALRLSKALWWMMARIAGWDGGQGGTSIDEPSVQSISNRVYLSQNYPNPFNYSTTITYSLPEELDVEIMLCDIIGRKVQVLYEGQEEAGEHTLDIILYDMVAGTYFYKLKAGHYEAVKKCIILK